MPYPVLVIREVEQLAQRGKWRVDDLADALGVTPSTLNRLRAGTHVPSREVLAAILRTFDDANVERLVLHFLKHELARERAARLDAWPQDAHDELARLDRAARERVQGFVTHFLRQSLVTGRGLRLIAVDDHRLRRVVGCVVAALAAQGINVVAVPANARTVAPSQREAACAAPLLVVERVEFASAAVQALLTARAAVRKPALLTSACATIDGPLAPTLALCATVNLDPRIPAPIPPNPA